MTSPLLCINRSKRNQLTCYVNKISASDCGQSNFTFKNDSESE